MPSSFLKFATNHTLLTKTLPRSGSSFLALCELIKNSLESDAKNIYIDIDIDEDEHLSMNARLRTISILDDGVGVQFSNLEKSLFRIATQIRGKNGVGRFSCFQIGTVITIETSSYDEASMEFLTSRFTMTYEQLVEADVLENFSTEVSVEKSLEPRSYFQITITKPWKFEELTKADKRKITEDFLPNLLGVSLLQFFPETILEKKVLFHINDVPLNPEGFTDESEESFSHLYVDAKGMEQPVKFIVKTVESDKINNYIQLKNSKNNQDKTVHSYAYDYGFNDGRARVMTVESPFIDEEILDASILKSKDKNTYIEHFSQFVDMQVREYLTEKENDFDAFVSKLKAQNYYPYRIVVEEQMLEKLSFDRLMFYAHTHNDILELPAKHLRVLFTMFQLSLQNGTLLDVLPDYVDLDDPSVQTFLQLLIDESIARRIQTIAELLLQQRNLHTLAILLRGEKKPSESAVVEFVQQLHWLFDLPKFTVAEQMEYEAIESNKKIGVLRFVALQDDEPLKSTLQLYHSDVVLTSKDISTSETNENILYIAGNISYDLEKSGEKEHHFVFPFGKATSNIRCVTWDDVITKGYAIINDCKEQLLQSNDSIQKRLTSFTPKVGTVHLKMKKTKQF
jgi:hypothetical protein